LCERSQGAYPSYPGPQASTRAGRVDVINGWPLGGVSACQPLTRLVLGSSLLVNSLMMSMY